MREELACYLGEGVVFHRNARNGGLVLRMPNGQAVKLFPSKGVVFSWLRGLCGQTKAHKQWRSTQLLLGLGLSTPRPVKVVLVRPWNEFESAFIYDYLEEAVPARDYLGQGDRHALWDRLAEDLSVMAAAGILFVDFHLGNVLVDGDGELWWIDPEVKRSRRLVQRDFWSRVERMYRKCDGDVLGADDWSYLCERLRERLPEGLAGAPAPTSGAPPSP